MKKSDIKNGMHIITNNGKEYLVINNVEATEQAFLANTIMVRLDGEGWLPLDNYDDNLRYRLSGDDNDDAYDIKEVYVPKFYVDIFTSIHNANRDGFTKLWERPSAKKMTKAEIEAKLNEKTSIDYRDIDRLKIGFNIVKKMPKTKSIHLENIKCITRSRDYNGKLEYTVYYNTASGISKHVTVKPNSFGR